MAEREFLRLLGAGCQTPAGARTWIAQGRLHMAVHIIFEHDLTAPPFETTHHASILTPKALASDIEQRVLSQA